MYIQYKKYCNANKFIETRSHNGIEMFLLVLLFLTLYNSINLRIKSMQGVAILATP